MEVCKDLHTLTKIVCKLLRLRRIHDANAADGSCVLNAIGSAASSARVFPASESYGHNEGRLVVDDLGDNPCCWIL